VSLPPILVIGSGHNGLTAAFYLARAGLPVIVVERRATIGGRLENAEFIPGYTAPAITHTVGPLRASIVRDMRLAGRGVEFVDPDPRLVSFAADGRPLVIASDEARTLESIRTFSEGDAGAYRGFAQTLARLGAFLGEVLEMTPPSLDGPALGEVWELLKTGRRFRALGRADEYRLLRWMPMAAADLVAEWFTTDVVQAAVATPGIFATGQGPWSAGTGAVLLLNAAVDPAPGGTSTTVKGGPGVLVRAMADAARQAGAEIRTGSGVSRIIVRDGRAAAVVLDDGTDLTVRAVVSSVDPKSTFLKLVDPIDLDPGFLTRIRNYRSRGTVARMNLALSTLPAFKGIAVPADLRGRLLIGPGIDYLERAFDASKYGEIPSEPYLDVAFPTLHEPTLAPNGAHVMSVHAQFAPYALAGGRAWEDASGDLAANILRTLDRYAPGIERLVVDRQVLTPVDLGTRYGLAGGHVLHGEPSLDQLFTMRPTLGWAQYLTPIEDLFICGSGTHPGGGIVGGSGQNAAREILKALKR
jgi:phytoene dehydrogenase-like protein